MAAVRDLFVETAAAALEAIGDRAVATAWGEPSALPGLTVGALAAHEARALSTVRRYLDGDDGSEPPTLLDAAGYVLSVLPDTSRDSDVNVGVAARATAAAQDGSTAVVTAAAGDLAWLRQTLPDLPATRTVRVKDGVGMLLDDYLETRIVELVVHHDDLAVSLPDAGLDDLPDEAGQVAVAVLAEVARRRSSTSAMVATLARRERAPAEPPRAL